MASSYNQVDPTLPIGQDQTRSSLEFLPRYFRTGTNQKFFDVTLDQMISVGNIDKINAYIGRKTTRAYTPLDSYIDDVSLNRTSYQLEPAVVIKDSLDNVTFFKDYNDYINQLLYFNDTAIDHNKTNSQEFYSWNPHFNWDKFVNYREYYWLPFGPIPVSITGQTENITSTYTVTVVDESDNFAFLFSPDGLTRNPSLKLYRGQTYIFDINCPGHPITFKRQRIIDDSVIYREGVVSDSDYTEVGQITFTVPLNAPDLIYYVDKNNINTSGFFKVYDIVENTSIDVEKEIIGKKTYQLGTGLELSNGMKVNFLGNVTPEIYSTGNWYVEGVGDKITLTPESELVTPSTTTSLDIEFDNESFDSQGFDVNLGYPSDKDYITINRSSIDRNPWSRYNRWFHKDVIETSAAYNNIPYSIDQSARAKRPIIEFDPNIQLWNFGSVAKKPIDLIDLYTTSTFRTIEGALGYIVDGVSLIPGMRVLFAGDIDQRVSGRIFKVQYATHLGVKRLTLIEEEDTQPHIGETVIVKNGEFNQGKMFYYDGIAWVEAQSKSASNQYPLFEVFDLSGNRYSDRSSYLASTFRGTKLFSYASGDTYDSELSLNIKYNNIGNIGDVVFDFNLQTDSFTYQNASGLVSQSLADTYLKKNVSLTDSSLINGWTTAQYQSYQPVIRQYDTTAQQNLFEVDVYNNSGNLTDLEVKVFVNGKYQQQSSFDIFRQNGVAYINFNQDLDNSSSVILETVSSAKKKDDVGFYKFPANFENNPENLNLSYVTLSQVINHVRTISYHCPNFIGDVPGSVNLRDLGDVSGYGSQIVQHSSPLAPIVYHFTNKEVNLVKSLRYASLEYNKFKKNFIRVATTYGYDGLIKTHFDLIMAELSKDKNQDCPFYLSDMVPFNINFVYEQEVIDNFFTDYPLTFDFNLTTLSNKAVLIYLNDELLTYGKDYEFINTSFVRILTDLVTGDNLKIVQYDNTAGCAVPPTPTKLGLYPAFEPVIYVDDTYQTPTKVIKGHDGSITVAFNDFRDDLLLELETRIYNNIKVRYDPALFNITDFISGYYRESDIPVEELNACLRKDFLTWAGIVNEDYTKHTFFNSQNPFTFNYTSFSDPNGNKMFGFWRGIYNFIYDTDKPHTSPWEMLGFTVKPSWWNDVYGPAPYTSDNLLLWNDIASGTIREPNTLAYQDAKYARPTLLNHIPVDSSGNLKNPLELNFVKDFVSVFTEKEFDFGDQTPIETAWRKSSHYPFALITAISILRPAKVFATAFDRSRQVRDPAGQLSYITDNGNKRFSPSSIVFPSTTRDSTMVFTSGLVNYLVDYAISKSFDVLDSYKSDLTKLKLQLASKLAGFTTKEKFKLILDSRSPLNQENVFIPTENYQIILNSSSPVESISYSGVIIEKTTSGFVIKGYNTNAPEFKYFAPIETNSDPVINVGGISESYVDWNSGKFYEKGQVVKETQSYYRVSSSHTSASTFEGKYFASLPSLPIVGGRSVTLRRKYSDSISTIHYGAELKTIQDVVDFLLGYGQYLISRGFEFTYFNNNIKTITDWQTSAKEFVFWTTQNWAAGAVITLSPAADELIFKQEYSVVDDIYDSFYGYSIFKQDGLILDPEFTNSIRDAGGFSLLPKNTADGIYHATLNLVQKEHVLLMDNTTVFNDVVYDQVQGYRQDRIKVIGYKISEWDGSFSIPGFVYDRALVTEWKAWKDYALGETVKYKEFYYSAKNNIPGTELFNNDDWYKLEGKPESKLIPNWDYRASQFADFYDLDSDSFDVDQQKFAQHLIGYQKRQYLENIINDDVSQYKFYQGMIQEKGTQNSLSKLFDVLASANKDSLEFYEEWAIRLGQYGASGSFEEVEYILDENKFLINPQPIELVTNYPLNVNDFVYRIKPEEVYIQPDDYTHAPLPTLSSSTEYISTAGYVNAEDVDYVIDTIDDVINFSIYDLKEGDYFWVGFDKLSWNVYRFTAFETKIKSVEDPDNGNLRINLNRRINGNLTLGGYVGINNTNPLLEGVNKVLAVGQNYFEVEKPAGLDAEAIETISNNKIITLFRFSPQRISSINDLNSLPLSRKLSGETVWTDGIDGNWTTWKFDKIYNRNSLTYESNMFGKSIAISDNETNFATSSVNAVYYYSRPTTKFTWVFQNQILPLTTETYTETNGSFGDSISFNADGSYMFISAPKYGILSTPGELPTDPPIITALNKGYVAQYTKNDYGIYLFTRVIQSPTPTTDEYFGHKTITNGNMLFIASRGSESVSSKLYAYNMSTNTFTATVTFTTGIEILDIDVSTNNTLVVSKSDETVSVYKLVGSTLTLVQEISYEDVVIPANSMFGITAAITRDSSMIAIGCPEYSSEITNQGLVFLFNLSGSTYSLEDTIVSPTPYDAERFGYRVRFNFASDKLAVYSYGGNLLLDTTFDDEQTTFDLGATRIVEKEDYVGNVRIYEKLSDKFLFADEVEAASVLGVDYGDSVEFVNSVYTNDPSSISGAVYEFTGTGNSWSRHRVPEKTVNLEKIKSIFLYSKSKNEILATLDIIDPIAGKIPGVAEQELTYKTYYDPATYSVGTDSTVIDPLMSWKTMPIGKLWWDLSTVKFINPSQGSVLYKANTWNTVFNDSPVEIYEWVESEYMPSEWDSLADTEEGLSVGISGLSKYGDAAYSVAQTFDNVSQTFKNLYYFWVKNKKTVPNLEFRKISANDVSEFISNPKSKGLPYITLLDSNQFALVNCQQYINGTDSILNIRYWISDTTESNVHSHYQLMAEGDTGKKLNKYVEQKWFDSLIGYDSQGRAVPDTSLPAKLKYGILSKPRQSMFVNRVEALKQFIERVNSVLLNKMIVDDYTFSSLSLKDPEPTEYSGRFDIAVDTYSQVRFVNSTGFKQASATVQVQEGKITRVIVTNAGKGYLIPPNITITSATGSGAKLTPVLNSEGSIVSVTIDNAGRDYQDATFLSIRPFTILVRNDETAANRWALYTWDSTKGTWFRSKTQTFDVTKHWEYVDWYDIGYNQFTKIDHLVDFAYELSFITVDIGEVVKIKNEKSGGWILLERINNLDTEIYSLNYKTIGRQNGTIQFKSNLYKFENSNVGYDSLSFDNDVYDDEPTEELYYILDCIRDNLLIDDLEVEYNKLFFASLRYVFSEQGFVDWAFKTSFVKSVHNLGSLKQKVNFKSDNLSSYEDYINEVKPYRTKIREFVSNYDADDNTNTSVTDFDLPAKYIVEEGLIQPFYVTVKNSIVQYANPDILNYPYKQWYDNVGYGVTEIVISDGGTGYQVAPQVTIVGNSKTTATAKAYLSQGSITKIVVETQGSGYLTTPTVVFNGSSTTSAKAVAILGDGLVRESKVGIKFDRLSPTYQTSNIAVTENFIGTGSKTKFQLIWPLNISIDKTTVIVDGEELLSSEYTVFNELDTSVDYTRYIGTVDLNFAPGVSSSIVIVYEKDINLLDAADRIQYYYNPEPGQIGKDLGQLMVGVDYGGVEVTGLDFDLGAGWDALPWNTAGWDNYDESYTDYLQVSDGVIRSYNLLYVPEVGEIINIYVNGVRIDDLNYDEYTSALTTYNTRSAELLTLQSEEASLQLIYDNAVSNYDAIVADQVATQELYDALDAIYNPPYDPERPWTQEGGTDPFNLGYEIQLQNWLDELATLAADAVIALNAITTAQNNLTVKQTQVSTKQDQVDAALLILNDAPTITNPDAQMNSFVGDGISYGPIVIPDEVSLSSGDNIIFRKSTSDGSFRPNQRFYDTEILGGDFGYTTARGVAAEEIIVDGDGFVTVTNSHAPEEIVAGQLVDAVDIQVYHKVSDGAPVILTKHYIASAGDTEFVIGQQPNTTQAAFVKVNDSLRKQDVDYTLDFLNQTITFLVPLNENDEVVITSMSRNGLDILDTDSFIGDGTTTEFVTVARWAGDYTAIVSINGVPQEVTTFITDSSYTEVGNIGIRFNTAPDLGDIIDYTILSSLVNSISNVKTETVIHNGVDDTYELTNLPGVLQPFSNNLLVEFDGTVLKPADAVYFDVSGTLRTYTVDSGDYAFNSIDTGSIKVYKNGSLLSVARDYSWTSGSNQLKIKKGVAATGDIITLVILKDADYVVETSTSGTQITFVDSYNSGDKFNITTFTNHDILSIERNNDFVTSASTLTEGTVEYFRINQLLSGRIKLRKPAVGAQYVWLTLNRTLLTPEIDYILEDTLDHIQIDRNKVLTPADNIEVIVFNSNYTKQSFGYRIFKDMLNRTYYKRIDDSSSTILAQPLNYYDTQIVVEDGSLLTEPLRSQNRPGVIFINKERIEYLEKSGNTLRYLRRGTLGTGTPVIHAEGSLVRDQSTDQTIPYKDETETVVLVADGYTTASTIYDNSIGMSVTSISYNFNNNTAYPLGGQVVTVIGTGFKSNVVAIVGDTACATTYVSATELTFISPAKLVGAYDLVILNPSFTVGSATVPATSFVSPAAIKYVQILLPFAPLPNPVSNSGWYTETIPSEYREAMDIEVFVASRRLRKNPVSIWNEAVGPDSPSGDVQYEAEFAVNKDILGYVRLTEPPQKGSKIIVQKKVGQMWAPAGISLVNSESNQAKFIRSKFADLPGKRSINT